MMSETRETVIELAYSHAVNGDIENISFVKLADELETSRRGLYRTFENKHDLLFEVYKRVLDSLIEEVHTTNNLEGCVTGYDKTIAVIENMVKVFVSNPNKVQYIVKYDAIADKSTKLLQIQNEYYKEKNFTQSYLKLGVEDGSVNITIDSYRTSCVILESIIGFTSRYLELAHREFSYYLDQKDLDIFVNAYKKLLK